MPTAKVLFHVSFLCWLAFACASRKRCDVFGDDSQEAESHRIQMVNRTIPNLCKGAFRNLVRLDTLELQSCQINSVEAGAFENLPSLRSLTITGNDFLEIPKDLFGNLMVRKLNLSDNGLRKIHAGAFENMLNLEVLDLSSNKLTTFQSDWFKNAPKLYRIDVQHNEISEIPAAAFANLVKHKVKKNDLELWMMHNKIARIDKKAFQGVDEIESLWLNDNEIGNVDVEVFANVQRIHTLFLDNNKLDCIDDQVLDNLHVQELDVDGNPFSCECLKKIKRWSRDNKVQLQSLRIGLKCLMVTITQLTKKNQI